MNGPKLIALLRRYQIPLPEWGRGEAKTPEHLLQEIKEKEIELIEDGKIIFRKVRVVNVGVYYNLGKVGGSFWRLSEDRQVFKKGNRVRTRPELEVALGEKIKPEEGDIAAAYRALREELGIERHLELIPQGETRKEAVSKSYPGLLTWFSFVRFDVILPEDLYKPEGYVEVQEDKTTYFVWKEITGEEFETQLISNRKKGMEGKLRQRK